MSSFAKDGRKILQSDFLTDVTLKCGDRVWKLHKLILVTRSKWFNRALCGEFDEATTNEINILEQDPTYVDWVITWIYTHNITRNTDAAYETQVRLLNTANFFLLDNMEKKIEFLFTERLRRKMINVQQKYILHDECLVTRPVPPEVFNKFLNGVSAAYECDNEWARSEFIGFVTQTQYWIFCNEDFRSQCKSVPKFYEDLLEGFAKFASSRNWVPHPPSTCYSCCRWVRSGRRDCHVIAVIRRSGKHYAACNHCGLPEGNLGEDSD